MWSENICCKGAIALNGHKFRTIPCFPAVSVASRLVNIKFNKSSSVFWYILMFHECCGSVIWYTKLNCQYAPNRDKSGFFLLVFGTMCTPMLLCANMSIPISKSKYTYETA